MSTPETERTQFWMDSYLRAQDQERALRAKIEQLCDEAEAVPASPVFVLPLGVVRASELRAALADTEVTP